MAPLIFEISKRKNKTVQQALFGNNWVRDINLLTLDTIHHFTQFTRLWQGLHEVELSPETQGQNYIEAHCIWGVYTVWFSIWH
jgi:hypothetical protein